MRVDHWQVRLAVALIPLCIAVSIPLRASGAREIMLPIRVHVVHVGDEPVAPHTFVVEQLEHANAIFAPHGVRFAPEPAPPPLPARHAALETRADRDALAAYARRGAIDCFVVRSLRDVDEPERMRQGVHWWQGSRRTNAHFVVLSSTAGPDVLAHELGHYLGNPSHSSTPGNLMSYQRGHVPMPFLDGRQLRRMRAAIARYLRTGELQQAKAAGAAPQQPLRTPEPAASP